RSIVAGVVLPDYLAGDGIEGIELVAAEAAADEHLAVNDCGRGQRPAAWNRRLPPRDLAVLALEWFWPRNRNGRRRRRLLNALTHLLSRQSGGKQRTHGAGQKRSPRQTCLVHRIVSLLLTGAGRKSCAPYS